MSYTAEDAMLDTIRQIDLWIPEDIKGTDLPHGWTIVDAWRALLAHDSGVLVQGHIDNSLEIVDNYSELSEHLGGEVSRGEIEEILEMVLR